MFRDPVLAEAEDVAAFLDAWNASGLKPILKQAFSPSLRSRLTSLLLDEWWAGHWRAAVAKAAAIPFFATGAGRHNGRLGVEEFLRDDDFARQVLDGKYDPAGPAARPDPFKEVIARVRGEAARG